MDDRAIGQSARHGERGPRETARLGVPGAGRVKWIDGTSWRAGGWAGEMGGCRKPSRSSLVTRSERQVN
jgi:hypothetical protein